MKAMVQTHYGSPDGLELRDVDPPEVTATGVLVRVRAASANALDWHILRGHPYLVHLSEGLTRPKRSIPGVDVAGVVEAVGTEVNDLAVGDEVFGTAPGSFAEFARGTEKTLVRKPAALSFEAAASIPVAGVTAIQALRDKGGVTAGQRVLVNGAAGGVGTFAVQVAKAMGAIVTGVCSGGNVDLVGSLGADHVIDYSTSDFAADPTRYDCLVDIVGNRSMSDCRRVLVEGGTLVIVGGPPGRWIGPLAPMLKAMALKRFVRERLVTMIADVRRDDLLALGAMAEAGTLTPAVDRTYSLGEAGAAISYLETGHARGKTVLTI